jgi:tRNA threonylcarbamoyladenosine biosynthesis protein TsaB
MNKFLAIQNTYQNVQFAIFDGQELRTQCSIDKKEASKLLVPKLANLLDQQQIRLTNLHFIAVNQGPGPFTTLRVIIASMNGLGFASNIPLIGVDAFDAMQSEWQDNKYPTTITLFNAFAGEVYFAITQRKKTTLKGYQCIDALLEQCAELPGTIQFIGNGASLYHKKIVERLNNRRRKSWIKSITATLPKETSRTVAAYCFFCFSSLKSRSIAPYPFWNESCFALPTAESSITL